MKKNHYTYLITYPDGSLYHGVRSCLGDISDDNYWGTSRYTPDHIEANKSILTTHESREDAVKEEIRYHAKNDVRNNKEYHNRANQKSTGFDFDSTGIKRSDETKEKMGRSGEKHHYFGKKFSKEHKAKLAASQQKRPAVSEETKKRLSDAKLGDKNGMFGVKRSAESRAKQSASAKAKGIKSKRRVCEHCGVDSAVQIYSRVHGDNCKLIK